MRPLIQKLILVLAITILPSCTFYKELSHKPRFEGVYGNSFPLRKDELIVDLHGIDRYDHYIARYYTISFKADSEPPKLSLKKLPKGSVFTIDKIYKSSQNGFILTMEATAEFEGEKLIVSFPADYVWEILTSQ